MELALDVLVLLAALGCAAQEAGLQGALDEGVAHIEQLIEAETLPFVAQADAVRLAAVMDGEIIGAGGELDVALGAVVLCVVEPVFLNPADLFVCNFCHKASPWDMIAQFSPEGKCFYGMDKLMGRVVMHSLRKGKIHNSVFAALQHRLRRILRTIAQVRAKGADIENHVIASRKAAWQSASPGPFRGRKENGLPRAFGPRNDMVFAARFRRAVLGGAASCIQIFHIFPLLLQVSWVSFSRSAAY